MNTKDLNLIFFTVNDTFDIDTEDNFGDIFLSNDTILYKGDLFTDARFVVNY